MVRHGCESQLKRTTTTLKCIHLLILHHERKNMKNKYIFYSVQHSLSLLFRFIFQHNAKMHWLSAYLTSLHYSNVLLQIMSLFFNFLFSSLLRFFVILFYFHTGRYNFQCI